MSERAGSYWVVGLLLAMVGVRGGLLPATPVAANVAAAATPPAKAPSAKAPRPPAASAPSESSDGGDCSSASVNFVCKPAAELASPDPCRRGQELLDEYTTTYRPTTSGGSAFEWTRDDYTLALVPDPELTDQPSMFEAVVEGLTEAATDGNAFVRDRQWLPWGDEGATCADEAPGVMLFRPPSPGTQPPRIVLLVGESPTLGVRTRQLRAAVTHVRERARATSDSALGVLGPTFSGTAASLVALLRPPVRPPLRPELTELPLRFVSGSATSPQLPELFADYFGEGAFSATVPNDRALFEAMRDYLRDRSAAASKIAILSETGTAYGSSVSKLATKKEGGAEAGEKQTIIARRFPVDLRSLRQAVAAAPEPLGSLDEAPKSSDDPRVLVLDEVARELSTQHVRFVGVVATNPADVVLLTRRLRAQLPDARFFTLGSDILYTTTSQVSPLNGMLVAHAAPPDPKRMPASVSMKSDLVRNVTLAGRKLFEPDADVAAPKPRISLIGNGSLWEIGDSSAQSPLPHGWRIIQVASVILLLLTILVSMWPWLAHDRPDWKHAALTRKRGPLVLAIGPCDRRDLRRDDALVTAALLSVVAAAPLLMMVTELSRGNPSAKWWCIAIALGVLLLCWTWPIILATNALWQRFGPRPQRRLHWPRGMALACGVTALMVVALALGIGCAPRHEATVNLLSGGSAVLVGLIGLGMLALALWCWRVRLRFLDTHRFGSRSLVPPLAQALDEHAGSGTGFFELERQLLAVIHSPWRTLPLVPVAIHVLLALSIALVFWVRVPAAFEPGWRNYLVIGFGVLALLPITVNFSRIIATFIVLNRLLKRLALEPILEHLRKLPPGLARNLEAQLTVPNADFTELAQPIELLQRIETAHAASGLKARQIYDDWRSALRHQAGEPDDRQTTHRQGLVVTMLLTACGALRRNGSSQLLEQSNQLVALLVAIFVPRYLRHFRLYVIPVLLGSALGVMMTSLYFIQPQRLIGTVIFVWVAGMVLTTFLLYQALDRSAVISAIGKTKEGAVELDWTLVSRMITWALVPLLSLLAAQYPGFSSWVTLFANGLGNALR